MKNTIQHIFIAATLGHLLMFVSAASAQQVSNPVDNKPVTVNPGPPISLIYPGLNNMAVPTGYNYVRTTVPDVPLQSIPSGSYYLRQSTDYFDGLGRPLQTVVKKGHADGNDIVNLHEYDSVSRETYQYLPYAAPTGGINYNGISGPGKMKLNINTQLRGFYDNLGPDEQPYGRTIFENSPLGRPIKQMAPGKSWVGASGGGRGITFDYRSNGPWSYTYGIARSIGNAYPHFTIGENNTDIPVNAGTYGTGELSITVSTDEDGKTSLEWKDKHGLLIARMQQATNATSNFHPTDYAYTFYVYDELGRLRCVMPPEAIKPHLNGDGWSIYWDVPTQAKITGFCYQYFYDERGRMTEKKIPGKDVEYYIYDKRDRQILYQDGNMRNRPQPVWAFTFYDVLDRPTVTGFGNSGASPAVLLNNYLNTPVEYPPNDFLYYMKHYDLYHTYPTSLIGCQILSYTYYDDYSNLSGFAYDNNQFSGVSIPTNNTVVAAPNNASTMTRGLPTGSKVRIMDPDDPNADNWLTTVNYYDDKGRVIQTQSQNMQGGLDISSNIYFFQGMLYKNILRHRNPNAIAIPGTTDGAITEYRLENTFERSLGVNGGNDEVWMHKQKINTSIDYHLSAYGYDHLGRNVLKQFTAGLNYQNYNLRGFLNGIVFDKYNQIDTLFNENLYYDKGFASKLYNGNIAGITWCGSDRSKYSSYGYSYDNLNRLTHAEFNQYDGTGWNRNNGYDYTVSGITYDLNGNIKSMNQMVTPAMNGGTILPMDQLTYTYEANSNKLIKVEDAIPAANTAAYGLPDFKNGVNTAVEYHYDDNGNMVMDDNKNITSITYNYLNKPEVITVGNSKTITYVYDAAGNRLQKKVVSPDDGISETWDYIGSFVYKDRELQYILNEEGRARPVAVPVQGTNDEFLTKFVYDYFVKDHLGNVRSTVTATPIDVQYRASHEVVSANVEELVFDHIPQVRDTKPGSLFGTMDQYAARLNGSEEEKRIGTALVLMTKAGDRFRLNVNAFYDGDFTQYDEAGTPDMLEALAGTLMGGTTPSGQVFGETENAQLMQQVFADPNLASQLADLTNAGNNTDAPKAHLNYLWFNDKMELDAAHSGSFQVVQNTTGSGWATIGTGTGGGVNPGQVGGGGTGTMNDGGVIAPGVGILLVYIDNQSIGKDVWFDNLVVDHYESEVVEEDHYYPYGLTLNTTPNNTGVTKNDIKFQNQRHEDDFGINIYSFKYRDHDPQIGRFWQIDPLAESYVYNSTYAFSENKVVAHRELEGLEAEAVNPVMPLPTTTIPGPVGKVSSVWILNSIVESQARAIEEDPYSYSNTGYGKLIIRQNEEATAAAIINTAVKAAPAVVKKVEEVYDEVNAGIDKLKAAFAQSKGRGSNNRTPDPDATGDHTVVNENGSTTYKRNDNNPNKNNAGAGFETKKRVDYKGAAHVNKKTGVKTPTPHVQEQGDVRPAIPGKDMPSQ